MTDVVTSSADIKALCVYCSASDNIDPAYVQEAAKLGRLIASHNYELVFGGGRVGLMGEVAKAAFTAGARVVGFMTEFLNAHEGGNHDITELHVVPSMHERKTKMFERADAFAILPGGVGTLDELFEILTWKQLGFHKKPIVMVNVNDYWTPIFKEFMPRMAKEGFIREDDLSLFKVVASADQVFDAIQDAQHESATFVSRWG